VRGGEASFLFCLDRKREHAATKGGGGTGVNTINKDDSYNKDGNDIASVGRQKTGRDPNDPADRAGDRRLEMRSTKVPTRSGRGAIIRTADDDILSGGMLPIASNGEFASNERGHKLNKDGRQEPRPLGHAEWPHQPGVDRPPTRDAWLMACLSGPSRATTTRLQPPQMTVWLRKMPRERQGRRSGLWSTPSGRCGLGWAGRRHKTPGGR
jgi:hypothetical protein